MRTLYLEYETKPEYEQFSGILCGVCGSVMDPISTHFRWGFAKIPHEFHHCKICDAILLVRPKNYDEFMAEYDAHIERERQENAMLEAELERIARNKQNPEKEG
jgi:hypothetical protein